MHQAKYFQKTLGFINTFLPGCGEGYVWDIVYSPALLQSRMVKCKTQETESWFWRSLSVWKEAESPLFISLHVGGTGRKGVRRKKRVSQLKRLCTGKTDFSMMLSTFGLDTRRWCKLHLFLAVVMEDLKKKKIYVKWNLRYLWAGLWHPCLQ